MKRLFAILAALLLVAACAVADTTANTISVETEAELDRYVAEFGLDDECKDVIMEYLPDVNSFDRIERESLAAYAIYMEDGTKYYLTVMKDCTPMVLQSAEEDHKMRTRYYDKFAK